MKFNKPMALSASLLIGLVACSQRDNAKDQQTELTLVVSNMATATANEVLVPELDKDASGTTPKWVPVKRQPELAAQVAQLNQALGRKLGVMAVNTDWTSAFSEIQSLIVSSDGTASGASSSSGLPTGPGVGSNDALPTMPGAGSTDALPTSPATARSTFSPTPALFAMYSGSGSGASFADAYCGMVQGIVNYAVRCVDGLSDAVIDSVESSFVSSCQQVVAEFEEQLGFMPEGLASTMSCIGNALSTASCTNPEQSIANEFASCGLATN
ncbi:MAG TPA: hypothetical protein VM901_05640 [Bdellovibrionota bacterium]|jgi:hypothetical protein|nr:hypothetical protein [Bdellovibrionota bacterium]